jgi:hypothetical protein
MGACNEPCAVIKNDRVQRAPRSCSPASKTIFTESEKFGSPIQMLGVIGSPRKALEVSVSGLSNFIDESNYMNSPERANFYLFTPCQQQLGKKNSWDTAEDGSCHSDDGLLKNGYVGKVDSSLERPTCDFVLEA